MTTESTLRALRTEMREELTRRILPYWMDDAVDRRHGGLVGLITDRGEKCDGAPKGAIVHARWLWTFSAAYRAVGDGRYREVADDAAAFFSKHFIDPVHGGVFWMVDANGQPVELHKHLYTQAFAIYAFAEHFRATGAAGSLEMATALFALVEERAADCVHSGYEEAFTRDWVPLADARLSPIDANERKSMNAHLHLLEAYATLFTVWPDARLRARLEALLELFYSIIVGPEGTHVGCFFAADWTPRSSVVSFGHDIEATWLLVEASRVLDPDQRWQRAGDLALRVARAVLRDGYDAANGGLFNERLGDGRLDTDKEWWPQAEAVVGFLGAFQGSARREFLDAAWKTWRFVKRHMLDEQNGEWHRRVSRTGEVRPGFEKVGPWKCSYHNARACLEVMSRVSALIK